MPRRAYLALQAALVEREERRWLPRMALNLAVSEPDRTRFLERAPAAELMVVPNCVDTSSLALEPPAERRGLIFVGPYDWQPNRDAMRHFCARVLPLVREREPDCPVTWLARADPDTCARLSRELDVTVQGYVEDIRPWVARAAAYVVPLRVGGGTRLKIVEAWALGSAVVSTTVGAEGLAAEDGRNILLADAPTDMADALVRVLRDPGLRDRLGAAGRDTATRLYDWDAQRDRLVTAYERLLDG